MRRVHLTASGRVQGVFFRASARDEAQRLGLTGWAANMPEGTVELEVQGEDDDVDRFIAFCRRGPGQSVVDDLLVDTAVVVPDEDTFDIR